VFNGTSIAATVPVGLFPDGAIYDSEDGYVYVINSGSNNVSVMNGTTVVGTVETGGTPWWIPAYDNGNGYVYVTNADGPDNVTVISGTTVVASVAVGAFPSSAVYDNGNGYVYVTNYDSGNVSVIDGTKIVETISTGLQPYFATYGDNNGYVYVTNENSNNVSAIFTGLPVQFTEYGLPAGTGWWVNVSGGRSVFSRSTSLSFVEDDGHYTYYISAANRTYSALAGSFTITNKTLALSKDVVFSRVVYALAFDETGLPIGTNWSVSLDGSQVASVNSTISFIEPNGSYAYVLGVVPGWTTAHFGGLVAVEGVATSQDVAWALMTYTVVLGETGLPASTGWWVNLTGGGSGYSVGTPITFSEPNGSYTYSVASANRTYASPGGSFEVNGSLSFQRVTFLPVIYTVTFLEVGLASGTSWTVGLYAVQRSSSSTSMTFSDPNGTYPFLVSTIPGYMSSPSSGNVTVRGTSTIARITFTAIASATYVVTFKEAGLPSGTTWSVVFHSTTVYGRENIAIPGVTNGTYSFSVDAVPGYKATPTNGSITVNGQGVLRAISFARTPSSSPATFLGFPSAEGYGGVIIAVLVVTTAVVLLRRRAGNAPPNPAKPDAGNPPAPP
jgi:YVTN family beta-propeller protein